MFDFTELEALISSIIGSFFTTSNLGTMLSQASWETFYMVGIATVVTTLFGIPLGVLLVVTREGHILDQYRFLGKILEILVNIIRSIPFIIFIILVRPLTVIIVGTGIGSVASIVPLTLAAVVFNARLAESALMEVPYGLVEAAESAGASKWQIIWHVMLPEAMPGLVKQTTVLIITLIGYSAMAGVLGGGGLGNLAVNYGHVRYMKDVLWTTVIILIIMVQVVQSAGDSIEKKVNKR